MTRARILLWVLALPLCALMAWAAADGAWLAQVPAKDHEKINPLAADPDAIAAGKNIFEEHCAKCHGANAEGTKKRPSLRSERVQRQATAGDVHWLLVNGNMKKGMPSWAKLPDPQLWQVICYLKSMHE
jgi:mono/diheme cytochrome c family protein